MRTRAKKGEWKAKCDDCQEFFYASMLVKMWDGKYVCRVNGCYENRHPSDFYRVTKEDNSVPFTREDDARSFVDDSSWTDTSTEDPDDTGHNNGDL